MFRLGATLLTMLTACAETPVGAAPVTADAISSTDSYSEFADVVAYHQRLSDRVARVSRTLRIANAPLCDRTRLDAGLTTHRLSDYPERLRPLALHFMDIGKTGEFVRSVVPGSPADRALLRRGDEILSGWPLSDDVPLRVDTGRRQIALQLDPDTACHIPTHVVQSDVSNASTDGLEIDLSTRLVEQIGDDNALALVIAHEMAHIIRGHTHTDAGWRIELQADADALVLMRNAGFEIDRTVDDWAIGVEAHRDSQAVSTTHPPVDIRLRNLREAQSRINSETESFLYLTD